MLLLIVRNPMHAVLGLILVFINSAIFLLKLEINFLALVYLVVYVGAIAVLFLFVIMLLNLRSTEIVNQKIYKNDIIFFMSLYLCFVLTYLITINQSISVSSTNSNIGQFLNQPHATAFISTYLLNNSVQLVILTVALFLAIVAPIAISTKQVTQAKKQNLFYALIRETNTIKLIK